jgi:hypothetical protein
MKQARESTHQDRHAGVDLVVFAVGALRFAVESRHVGQVVDPSPDPLPDPRCHQPGETAPYAPALAELLGLAPAATPGPRERLLRLKTGRAAGPEPAKSTGPEAATERTAARDASTWDSSTRESSPRNVRIQEPVSLLHCPVEALYPMPALVTALCALPCLRGLVGLDPTNPEEVAILLDPGRLPKTTQGTQQGTEHAEAQTSRAALPPTSSVWAD